MKTLAIYIFSTKQMSRQNEKKIDEIKVWNPLEAL